MMSRSRASGAPFFLYSCQSSATTSLASCSGTGMGGLIDGPQPVAGQVGVDLRRREISVTEELLHDTQVGTAIEEVRRVCVTERVRVELAAVAERERGEDTANVARSQHA